MQPKTETKTKDNLEASRENKKEILNKREFTPAEQWDQLAFTLIRQELAPKGYSEIKRGPWRGKVQSNIPFLPKSSVERCQKVAAQLVRAYRDKVRIEIEAGMAQLEKVQIKYQEELNDCHFWQFKRKSDISHNLRSVMGQSGSLIHVLNQLDNIGIK
jgi:hypothetical protein